MQRQKAAPQPRFLGAHPNLEVAFQVSRAIQRQPQEVDGFRALSAALARVSLRESTKLNQLGFGCSVSPHSANRVSSRVSNALASASLRQWQIASSAY
ncbi:MAG: hypothetical protein WBW73_25000, partial [Rhodoplanes sp.]